MSFRIITYVCMYHPILENLAQKILVWSFTERLNDQEHMIRDNYNLLHCDIIACVIQNYNNILLYSVMYSINYIRGVMEFYNVEWHSRKILSCWITIFVLT
jgi:hypothetical protein